VMPLPGGASALILQHGGRFLGIFLRPDEENCFWTNPALADAPAAKALFEGIAWHNTGGERTWLAPEIDFFYPNWPNSEPHCPPPALDTGQYEWGSDSVTLRSALTLHSYRTGQDLPLKITKTFHPAPYPLPDGPGQVEYGGLVLRASLEVREPRKAGYSSFGLWSLLQLPDGGEVLVPTHESTAPRMYFGDIPNEDLQATEQGLRWSVPNPGAQKIGIAAVVSTGRLGYVYRSRDRWVLIVKDFAVDPVGEYVDAPWNASGGQGDAVQVCHVDTAALGAFCELEHHTAALGSNSDRTVCEDVSKIWAFRGSRSDIRRISGELLGIIPTP